MRTLRNSWDAILKEVYTELDSIGESRIYGVPASIRTCGGHVLCES